MTPPNPHLETTILDYISSQVLEGSDVGLDAETPLLEWGLLNSIEMTKLIRHLDQNAGVRIPMLEVVPKNFVNVRAIAALADRCRHATD